MSVLVLWQDQGQAHLTLTAFHEAIADQTVQPSREDV
jgi:hypothetical protein